MNESRQITRVVFSLGFEGTFFLLPVLFSGKHEKRELDNKRMLSGIVILTKRICYYLLLLFQRMITIRSSPLCFFFGCLAR